MEVINEIIEQSTQQGHGEGSDAVNFDLNSFNYNEVAKTYFNKYADEYLIDLAWGDVIYEVGQYADRDGNNVSRKIEYLRKENLILAMFGYGPSAECDQSEYCSFYYAEIYLKNGLVLNLSFDWTT